MSDVFVHKPFGELPKTWDYQAVESFVEYLTGPAFDSAKFNEKKLGVRLLRGINLTKGATRWNENNTKYWSANLPNYEKYLLSEGDIVVGMDGSLVGKNYAFMQKHDLPSLLVQRVARLRTLDNIDAKYLFYIFASDEWLKYVELVKTNSGIPHISNSDIKSLRIPYPPVIEQKKIASILTSVDEVIENTQKQIDKLQHLKKATMNELLNNGIGHTEFKDSELGKIPKSWEVKSLADCGEFSKGKGISKSETKDYGLPCIRYAEIYTEYDYIINQFISFIDATTATNSKRLHKGDIIFAGSGETVEDIGKSVAFIENIEAYVGGDTVVFSPNKNLNSEFLSYQLNDDLRRIFLRMYGQGSSVIHIYGSSLEKILISVPGLEEQEQIAAILRSIAELISEKFKHLERYYALKKSLMQDLLTGRVRVQVN